MPFARVNIAKSKRSLDTPDCWISSRWQIRSGVSLARKRASGPESVVMGGGVVLSGGGVVLVGDGVVLDGCGAVLGVAGPPLGVACPAMAFLSLLVRCRMDRRGGVAAGTGEVWVADGDGKFCSKRFKSAAGPPTVTGEPWEAGAASPPESAPESECGAPSSEPAASGPVVAAANITSCMSRTVKPSSSRIAENDPSGPQQSNR